VGSKQIAQRRVRSEAVRAKPAPAPARTVAAAQVLPRRNWAAAVAAIARRELGTLLRTPVGWAVAAVFLFFASGFGFIGGVIAGQQASMDGIYQVITGVLTLVLVPVLTLRLAAESQPTIPARDYEVIAGRWLGAFAFYVLLIAATLVYIVLLAIYVRGQQLDYGLFAATYIGMVATGAAAVAIGVFGSSVTRNRVVAYLLGVGLLVMTWYATFVIGSFSGTARNDLLDYVSAFDRYQSSSLGQVTLRDTVYFVSLALGALLLATPLLKSRR